MRSKRRRSRFRGRGLSLPALRTSPGKTVAYQVAASMLVAEQQQIWTRLQVFFGLGAAGAAFIANQQAPQGVAVTLAIFGLVMSLLSFVSLRRSWNYRDHYVDEMKTYERRLGLGRTGPATSASDREKQPGRIERLLLFTFRGDVALNRKGKGPMGGFSPRILSDILHGLYGLIFIGLLLRSCSASSKADAGSGAASASPAGSVSISGP